MFVCSLCEKETCYVSKFCNKCRRIKHFLNLYNDRVYDVLDNVLAREQDKQENKVSLEIQKEIKINQDKIKTRSQYNNNKKLLDLEKNKN
tara:strand:+ start:623 stop:892 length:270 start_codon:yes stop_codon:yes gene_type:complete